MPRINRIIPNPKEQIVQKQLLYLRRQINSACLRGDCKTFKNAQEKFAKIASNNFYCAKKINFAKPSAPLFSREGLNIIKVMIYNIFRPRTTDEKNLYHKIHLAKKTNFKIFG